MKDLEMLNKTLLLSHYETGREIYSLARSEGHNSNKAAALTFAAGFFAGRDAEREKTKDAYKKMDVLKAAAAATRAKCYPGMRDDQIPSYEFLPCEKSPTPGEEQEGNDNE